LERITARIVEIVNQQRDKPPDAGN
jgi:hypothetical protein